MNKVILMGRLTRDPEVRYSQGNEPMAIVRYSLAVQKRFKRQNDTSDADFFDCVAFGKTGEFASRYFQKGQMVAITGRLSIDSWQDQSGVRHTRPEIIVEDQYFAESKKAFEASKANAGNFAGNPQTARPEVKEEESMGFYPVDESIEDDDLPF